MNKTESLPTLQNVRTSAAAMLYCLAHTLNLQVRQGGGSALLCLEPSLAVDEWPAYQDFDLSCIDSMKGLETVYRYGAYGETEGFISDDFEEGSLGCLNSLFEFVDSSALIQSNWDDIADAQGPHDNGATLRRIVELAMARYQLDYARHVGLPQLALLADLNERSVRNALHASGESMLAATRDERGNLIVEKSEALRWLRSRRNFKETVRIGSWGSALPEELTEEEIMPFLQKRLEERFSVAHLQNVLSLSDDEAANARFDNAGNSCGMLGEQVRRLFEQSIDELSPDDCPQIAQILLIDKAWLTTQLMRARFPDAMKEIAPGRPVPAERSESPFNEVEGTLEVVLTDAGIRNGYFDIERRYADRFFPSDCFGSRGGDQKAKEVALHHELKNSPYMTDMRVKSEALVSPRKRFSAYFTAHSAKAGDVIQIKRISERRYELTYLTK